MPSTSRRWQGRYLLTGSCSLLAPKANTALLWRPTACGVWRCSNKINIIYSGRGPGGLHGEHAGRVEAGTLYGCFIQLFSPESCLGQQRHSEVHRWSVVCFQIISADCLMSGLLAVLRVL